MIGKCIKKFCNEDISLIENYDKAIADLNQTWDCHHRREIETSRKELIKIGEYYNRPARELIFLTHSEHSILHNKGKQFSEKTRQLLSDSNKGKNKGKTHDHGTGFRIKESDQPLLFKVKRRIG